MPTNAELLARLQKDILSLQGYKPACTPSIDHTGLGSINASFPDGLFPFAAVHEFFCTNTEQVAASGAFITGLLSSVMHGGAVTIWVSSSRLIFPPALKFFGVDPSQIIFIDLKKEKEVSGAVEEALKCTALAAVVGEMPEMSFTVSRRFQLAIEQSGVPLFVLRRNPRNLATSSVTRWQIRSLPSSAVDDLPGVGYPRWQVKLLKVRNGKTGVWDLEWKETGFRPFSKLALIPEDLQKKAG